MSTHKNTTTLKQLLETDEAPTPDQTVTYGVGEEELSCVEVHDVQCPDGAVARISETTVNNLLGSLSSHHAWRACSRCFGEHWGLASEIVQNSRIAGIRLQLNSQMNCMLLLCFEAWKPSNHSEWTQALSGKTAEQIRLNAKKEIGWTGRDDGQDAEQNLEQVLYFDVSGKHWRNWMVGLEDHVTVARGLPGSPPTKDCRVLHGLIPAGLAEKKEIQDLGPSVAVGKQFTKTHLDLAVNLYETWRPEAVLSSTDSRVVRQTVEKAMRTAVQTAKLCLV